MLQRHMAEEAVGLVLPSILHCMRSGKAKREALHIVVAQRRTGTEHDFLYEYSIGDPTTWTGPYQRIARSKAVISLRTLLSTAEVQHLRSDLLQPGDTKYWGSAVRGTIVVGASGVESYNDEMFANWTADACIMLLKRARASIATSEGDFI